MKRILMRDLLQEAKTLERLLVERIKAEKKARGLSDEALGEMAFSQFGYKDLQKKVNNLFNSKGKLRVQDFFILCEALHLPADRLLGTSIDKITSQQDITGGAAESPQRKSAEESPPQGHPSRPASSLGDGSGNGH